FHPGLRIFIQETRHHRFLQHTAMMQIEDQRKVRRCEFTEVDKMKSFSRSIQVTDQPIEAFEVDGILGKATATIHENGDVERMPRRKPVFAMEQIKAFHEFRTLDQGMYCDHPT